VDAGAGYLELRLAVREARLLDRALGYYAWRSLVSFALLALGIALGLSQPGNPATSTAAIASASVPGASAPTPFGSLPIGNAMIAFGSLPIFNAMIAFGSLSIAASAAIAFGSILAASVLIAFGSVQVALVGHDAGHRAIFSSARANSLAGWLCWSLALGISFAYWHDRHTRHHTNTNDLAADPDLQWAGLVAYTDAAVDARPRRRWLMRHQALLGPAYTLALAFAFRAEGWAFAWRHLTGWPRAAELATLAVSLALWLLPSAFLGWSWLITFVIAQVLAGLYLALVIAPNHKGMPTWPAGTPLSFVQRQVLSSRNNPPHPLTDFVFGGLNYQIEHHLFPTMPRAHFRAARRLVRPFCAQQGLTYEELGVWRAWRLVLSELQRVGVRAAAAEWG
jgi:fatty acid desaturase